MATSFFSFSHVQIDVTLEICRIAGRPMCASSAEAVAAKKAEDALIPILFDIITVLCYLSRFFNRVNQGLLDVTLSGVFLLLK